jgi:hypothetical protein
VLDFNKIEEVIINRKDLSESFISDYTNENKKVERYQAIKAGNILINVNSYKEEMQNSFKHICEVYNPNSIYEIALCLALYNSQVFDNKAISKILYRIENKTLPFEYKEMVKETYGWVFWDYQFLNILRLFTLDRDMPNSILKEYKKYGIKKAITLVSNWNISGKNILESIEDNMAQKNEIYRLLMKPAWEIYKEISI